MFSCNDCALYLTGLVVVISMLVYFYLNSFLRYWKKIGVPFIEPKFFYGNCKDVIQRKVTFGELCARSYSFMKEKGHRHMGFYIFHRSVYMPIHPDLIKNILTKDFHHFYDRGVYTNEESDPLSCQLAALSGSKWKNLRAKLTPTFSSGHLKKMFPIVVESGQKLVDSLTDAMVKSKPVDIEKFLEKYTIDVIGSCAFGIECNSFNEPDSNFSRLGKRIFNPLPVDRIKNFLAFLSPELAERLKLRVTNKEVEKFYTTLVKDTINYRETNNITRDDFLQLLIHLKNNQFVHDDSESDEIKQLCKNSNTPTSCQDSKTPVCLTLNEACAQAFMFFSAGFETSLSALTFCLLELAQHVDIQMKLRQEILSGLDRNEGKLTYNAIMEMSYLDRVIQESLRKYPPLLIAQRIVTEDYPIPNTNITLEKGRLVWIPIYALQHDPEYFQNPDLFDPDRFLKEQKSTRPDFTYLPFGEGPRNCIGQRFAVMQIKVAVCQLLKNYRISVNVDTKLPVVFDPNSFVASPLNTILFNIQNVTSFG